MAFQLHTIEVPGGVTPQKNDRIVIGNLPNVANAAGTGAGASVTVSVTGLSLPAAYGVSVEPSQDANCFVTNKTSSGFTVTMNPRLATNTLAAGTLDIIIIA